MLPWWLCLLSSAIFSKQCANLTSRRYWQAPHFLCFSFFISTDTKDKWVCLTPPTHSPLALPKSPTKQPPDTTHQTAESNVCHQSSLEGMSRRAKAGHAVLKLRCFKLWSLVNSVPYFMQRTLVGFAVKCCNFSLYMHRGTSTCVGMMAGQSSCFVRFWPIHVQIACFPLRLAILNM